MSVWVFKEFVLYCAHSVKSFGESHKCSRIHGHSYKIRVEIESPIDGNGITIPFDQIDHQFNARVKKKLDHSCLNDHFGDNPTTEVVASFIAREMTESFGARVIVTVKETESSGVIVR